MGKILEEEREKNIDKIKVGACLEFNFFLRRLEDDIDTIKGFVTENSEFLNNQTEFTINKNFDDIKSLVENIFDIVLSDIDKEEIYCKYHSRYY